MMFRKPIMDLIRSRLSRLGVSDEATRDKIAEHGADTVEKGVRSMMLDWSSDEVKRFSARTRVYIEREAALAYREAFSALLQADIEKAAQRHLLATLGPRVEALEKVIRTEKAP